MPVTPPPPASDDLLAALLAASPPRRVPPALQNAAHRQSRSTVFTVLGLLFLAFGLFGGWLIFPWGIGRDWQLNDGPTAHATGKVTYASATGLTVGASRSRPGNPVYAYYFSFIPAGGAETSGVSYTTGLRPWEGTNVDIEYFAADPAVARVAGSRNSQRTWSGLFPMAVFAVLGLINVGSGWWLRRNARRLLESGALGEALVQSVERIGSKGMYKITLLMTAAGHDGPLVVMRGLPAIIGFFTERLASKQPVFVLFDPAKPKRAIFPETLI